VGPCRGDKPPGARLIRVFDRAKAVAWDQAESHHREKKAAEAAKHTRGGTRSETASPKGACLGLAFGEPAGVNPFRLIRVFGQDNGSEETRAGCRGLNRLSADSGFRT